MESAEVKLSFNKLAYAILFLCFGSQCRLHVVGLHLPSELCGYNSTAHYIGPSIFIKDKNDRRMLPNDLLKKAVDLDTITQRLEDMAKIKCKTFKGEKFREPEYWNADGSFTTISYTTNKLSGDDHAIKLCGVLYYELFDEESPGVSTEKIIQSFKYITYTAPYVPGKTQWIDVIGNPYHMWRPAILARDIIPRDLMVDYLNRWWRNTDHGDVWNTTCRDGKNAGGNFGPRALTAIPEAILKNEFDAFHTELKYRLIEEIVDRRAFMNNSFRFDGGLHQHNYLIAKWWQLGEGEGILMLNQNYMANYGKELLMNVARVFYLMSGTSYEFEEDIRNATFNCFFEGENWIYRGHIIDPPSTGRKIDQGEVVTDVGSRYGVLETLTYLGKVPFRQNEVASSLHRYNTVRPDPEHALVGNKHFFLSDTMAHQRRDYMATLRMMSRRCVRPETLPDLKKSSYGYFLGDGFLTLVVDGNELGVTKSEIFQAYDWAMIPGVTCPYMEIVPAIKTGPKYLAHMFNNHLFVGGVSDGNIGLAAMVHARPTVSVRARKSYFFLDNVILAIGTGITQTNQSENYNIITTLNQVMYNGSYAGKLMGDIDDTSVAGQKIWSEDLQIDLNAFVHHQTVGYVSLRSDGKLKTEMVTDKTIGNSTGSVFSIWIDHGPLVADASYAYAMLPSHDLTKTMDFADNPTVNILHQTDSKHDACDLSSKVEGVVLFEAGCFQIGNCLDIAAEVCSDQPSMILAKIMPLGNKENCVFNAEIQNAALVGSIIRLDVADPTHVLDTLNLVMNKDGQTSIMVDLPNDPKLGDTTTACFVFTN